jgi:hypothetical protein
MKTESGISMPISRGEVLVVLCQELWFNLESFHHVQNSFYIDIAKQIPVSKMDLWSAGEPHLIYCCQDDKVLDGTKEPVTTFA